MLLFRNWLTFLITLNFILSNEIDFNFTRNDKLGFIHIQKTSGSYWLDNIREYLLFNDNNNGEYKRVCNYLLDKCAYDCMINNNASKETFFWDKNEYYGCDIHADYSELIKCIRNDRKFNENLHLMTILRKPIERFISEYHHVKQGATWIKSVRHCNEQILYNKSCYEGYSNWTHATWDDFLNCKYNQASNRQVRMLANYTQLGCDILKCWTDDDGNCSKSLRKENEEKLLESAKKTLMSLSFFGIAEYQRLSQYLFENTFKGKFKFISYFVANKNKFTSKVDENYRSSLWMIKQKNHLDIQLYKFAYKEFIRRVKAFYSLDKNFD